MTRPITERETGAAGDVAEVNQCGGIIHDDAAALQADERDEQTDTGSDRLSQRDSGRAFTIASRTLVKVRIMNIIPSIRTAVSANCQL